MHSAACCRKKELKPFTSHGFYNHHSTQLSLALVKGDNESILSQISFDQTRFTRTGVARRL